MRLPSENHLRLSGELNLSPAFTFTDLQPHIRLKLRVKTGSPASCPLTPTLTPTPSPALSPSSPSSSVDMSEAPSRDDRCHCVLALPLQRLHAATSCCLPPNKGGRLHGALGAGRPAPGPTGRFPPLEVRVFSSRFGYGGGQVCVTSRSRPGHAQVLVCPQRTLTHTLTHTNTR